MRFDFFFAFLLLEFLIFSSMMVPARRVLILLEDHPNRARRVYSQDSKMKLCGIHSRYYPKNSYT